MSGPRFSIIPGGAVDDPGLTLTALRLLCYLGRHTNRQGWCRIYQKTIAEELKIARSTVQLNLNLLYERGWVEKRHGGRDGAEPVQDGRPFAANYYRVRIDRPQVDRADDAEEVSDKSGTPSERESGTPCPAIARAQRTFSSNDTGERDARAREVDEPRLEEFLKRWPTAAQDDQHRMNEAWQRLSIEERHAALDGIEPFDDDRKRQKRRHTPAGWRYLEERRWQLLTPNNGRARSAVDAIAWDGHPVAAELRTSLGAGVFDTWLAPCRLEVLLPAEAVVLHAPKILTRDYIRDRLLFQLERAFAPLKIELHGPAPG